MKRIDTDDSETFWKIALVGPGGTGKTSMGVSAPRPLILLSERQGKVHVQQAAKRLGVPMPPIVLIEDAQDYRVILKALRGPRDKPFHIPGVMTLPVEKWPLTAVLDSMTDACDVLVTEIRKKAPQKDGRDGLPADAQRFWGVLIDRTTGIIKGFRDLPMNVVFLCLMSDKVKEDKEGRVIERIISPKLATRDLANTLCAAVNVMAYTYRTMNKRKLPEWGVMTIGPEGMMTKPCAPLLRFEVPDLTSWIDRLNGEIVDVVPPLMPESMELPDEPDEPEMPEHRGFQVPSDVAEVYRCTQCDTIVEVDGQLCGVHEAELEEAQSRPEPPPEPPDEPPTEPELPPEPPVDTDPDREHMAMAEKIQEAQAAQAAKAAPAMVPCVWCGKRMGTKAYNEGKRRACDESAGDCEPTL